MAGFGHSGKWQLAVGMAVGAAVMAAFFYPVSPAIAAVILIGGAIGVAEVIADEAIAKHRRIQTNGETPEPEEAVAKLKAYYTGLDSERTTDSPSFQQRVSVVDQPVAGRVH